MENLNPQLIIIGEVALAMVLGGLIGIERELADKPAGFRTHMLVSGAAALFVGLGNALLHSYNMEAGDTSLIRSDPLHIIKAIITGVSFLGAGTIFSRGKGERVSGLTTAASILLSSGIGIAVALHQFIVAAGVTFLALIVLRGVAYIEEWMKRRRPSSEEVI